MLFARRALLVTIGISICAGMWYITREGYLKDVPSSFEHWKSPTNPRPESQVSPNIIFDKRPPPGSKHATNSDKKPTKTKPKRPKRPPASRFSTGQQVFGSRIFNRKYPVQQLAKFNHGLPLELPKVQANFKPEDESEEEKKSRQQKLKTVKESFEHAWKGYKEKAWLKDELAPLDGTSVESFGGWAATLVDTLDTLWIMGMEKEFEEAVEAVAEIDFFETSSSWINLFETTIRYLGGFLGAYDICQGKYPILLRKAVEVGDLIYCAFDTPNHMPVTRFSWREVLEGGQQEASSGTSIAEIGSMSLELTRLSQLTGDMKYFDVVQRIYDHLDEAQSKTSIPGLWPTFLNAAEMTFDGDGYTLGAMADSAYEYLPKMHMLLGGRGDQLQRMYESSVTAAMNHIFYRPMLPDDADILFSGTATARSGYHPLTDADGQHLGCYVGGMVGIGAKIFEHPEQMNVARKLTDGCIWAYDSMTAGIMPEGFRMIACDHESECKWDENKWRSAILEFGGSKPGDYDNLEANMTDSQRIDRWIKQGKVVRGYADIRDPRYLLRPEAIESVFVYYRLTGEKEMLKAAWRMFEAVNKHSRTQYGNAQILDVREKEPEQENKMESFWMAETLKYFYLIFADPSVVSLDEYVLNTEAHTLKRPTPGSDEIPRYYS